MVAPYVGSTRESVPDVAQASTTVTPLDRAPFAGSVSGVTYAPNADITGVNTNTRLVSLINKGQDGNGSTVIASLQFNSGVNALDFDDKDITLSVVANATNVAAGDILVWSSAAVSAGLADPGGLVTVTYSRSQTPG